MQNKSSKIYILGNFEKKSHNYVTKSHNYPFYFFKL